MSEIQNERKVFTLYEVTSSIRKAISARYTTSYWIKAEINKLNYYSHSGHCYPDLVEKKDGQVIAQIRANIWKKEYRRINERFIEILHEPLKDGIKVLLCASIQFDPVHGLSLNILDIDPSFSLGELEREKQETISRLKREGIFQQNKKLVPALLPQRIAVISVETSKGYADFLKVVNENMAGYKFFQVLFPALLQGDKAVHSIISQLHRIKKVMHHFDVVAIIRGGGGDVGLSAFNQYELAREIATFPLPVLTGIGHSTNETVSEIVAYKNAITPTELGMYLLDRFHAFAGPVNEAGKIIVQFTKAIVQELNTAFFHSTRIFRNSTFSLLSSNRQELRSLSSSLRKEASIRIRLNEIEIENQLGLVNRISYDLMTQHTQRISEEVISFMKVTSQHLELAHTNLNVLERNIRLVDPVNVLRRGYSITLLNGKAVRSIEGLSKGELITTVLQDGEINSEVISYNQHKVDE